MRYSFQYCFIKSMNLSKPSTRGQDATKGHFFMEVHLVWIQNFPSPRLVVLPRLKNLGYPTSNTLLVLVTKKRMAHAFHNGFRAKCKRKQLHPELELQSPFPFSQAITVTLKTPPKLMQSNGKSWFVFIISLHLDWLPYQCQRT